MIASRLLPTTTPISTRLNASAQASFRRTFYVGRLCSNSPRFSHSYLWPLSAVVTRRHTIATPIRALRVQVPTTPMCSNAQTAI